MTTIRTLAAALAALAAIHAPDAFSAPDRTGIQTRWLAGQIESARSTDNAAVERDAFRRLLSMSPDDSELQLDYLRHLFRYGTPEKEDEKEVEELLKKLCASPESKTCRDAGTLARVARGDLAQAYAALRLLAVAGRHGEAAREVEKLFHGVPSEPSLQLEYADMLLRTDTRRAEGKALLENLLSSPSLFISQRAKRRLADEAFEEALDRALETVYRSATRAESVATLERLYAERPDDPRAERWRNAIAEGRYWLASDRGDELLKRGALKKAEAAYREALSIDPERPFAYAGLADVALRRGDRQAALRLLEKAVAITNDSKASYRAVLTRRIAGIHRDALEAKAERLAPPVDADGNFLETPSNEYVAALRQALEAGEPDPWTTGRLARALWARGETTEVDRLWKTTFRRSAPDARAEWRYAEALFRRSADQPEKALRLAEEFLADLPVRPRAEDAERIQAMRDLARTLRTNIAVARAESLAESGRFAEALRALPDESVLESWQLAKAADWAQKAADHDRARSLWRAAGSDPAWREEAVYGEIKALLARGAEHSDDVRKEVVRLVLALETENAARGALTAKSLARMTGVLDDAGAEDEALALVERRIALLDVPADDETEDAVMLWRRVAAARDDEGRHAEALDAYRRAFARAGFLQNEKGNAVSFTRAMRMPEGANAQPVEGAPVLGPDGWLAQSLRSRAAERYAEEEVRLNFGVNVDVDPGTGGYSDLTALTWMSEASFPALGGRATLRTDSVGYDMGHLGSDPHGFGASSSAASDFRAADPVNRDFGQSVAFRWEGRQLDFDIGTTPMGMLYSDPTGSVNWSWDAGNFGLSAGVYYRPEFGSLLALGGQRDPATGREWGGVRRTGLRFSLSHDLGGRDGFWLVAMLERIRGHDVADNTAFKFMAGWYRRVVDLAHHKRTAGVSALYWHYDKDLSDYYFGQGGYYSPNDAGSVGGFVEESCRTGRWSWTARARLSLAASRSEARDRYPLKSKLAGLGLSDIDAREEADSSVGLGVSVFAAAERRLSKHAVLGASVTYQHDTDRYAPFYAGLWLRWHWDGWEGDLPQPPTPMTPYAKW